MSTNQIELLEKHEEWQDTIEVKPSIKTNIKMRVTPEQRKKIEKIGPLVKHFSEKTKYMFIYSEFPTWSEDDDIFMKDTFEEIDPELFIRTNGTCIEKEEFTYPMWFRYKVFDLGYIVRFDSLTTGEVIPHRNWTLDCYICNKLTPHTNTTTWEQVEEPKAENYDNKPDEIILVDAYNEHYKKQKIDTIARCKANMTLEQQKAICIFNCDKYLHREKGQNLSDIQKVRYYLDWLEDVENKLKEKE